MTDIIFPNNIGQKIAILNQKNLQKSSEVVPVICDAENLPFKANYFDQIIVTCVLHHLKNPNKALIEAKRVLSENFSMSILIPKDPSFLYFLLFMIFSAPKLINNGIKNPWQHHKRQHINDYNFLIKTVSENFKLENIVYKHYPHRLIRLWTIAIITGVNKI